MSSQLRVDVYIELVCPWCLIGKRHLDKALDQLHRQHPELAVQNHWHPFQLLPQIPVQGVPYQRFYEQRLGGPLAVAARRQQVQQAAATVGLQLNFDAIGLMPNTRQAHRLMDWASARGDERQVGDLIEGLFAAYFLEGKDIGDRRVLGTIAAAAQLDAEAAMAALETPSQDRDAAAAFVSGVPHFVFNGRVSVSGAQPASVLLDAIGQVL